MTLAKRGGLRWVAVAALTLMATAALPARAPAQTTADKPVQRAKKVLEREVDVITRLMHPTATHESTEATVEQEHNGKFQIVSKYYFKNFFGQEFFSSLEFCFDAKGVLEEIHLGDRDAWLAPFTAADLTSNIIEMVRRDQDVASLLRRGQTRAGLILWINGGN